MNLPAPRFLDRTTPPHIFTLVTMAGLTAMSVNLFLPALPAMAEHFQTDYAVMQLTVSTFLVVNAVLQLVIGPLSDRFGRRPVAMAGTIIFIVTTCAMIYAPNIGVFLVLRAVQSGIVTGMVLSRTIARDVTEGAKTASLIAYITMGMSLIPMVAPWMGGILAAQFGWEANFWFLTIVGSAILALLYYDLGETRPNTRAPSAREMLQAFPELLRSRRFMGYALTAATASGSYFAYLGGAPFIGAEIFGLSEDMIGLYMATPAIGYFAGNFLSGQYSTRIGQNRMILIGAAVLMLSTGLNAAIWVAGVHSADVFFGFMVILGLANGLQLPNAIAGSLSVRPDMAGTASGVSGSIMIGGSALFSAVAGTQLDAAKGALPLLVIMMAAGISSFVVITWVIRREAQLAES